MIKSIFSIFVPVHREGYRFIGIFAAVALLLFFVWKPLGWLGVIATLWCVYFFRDPARVTPLREGLVISPADGRVSLIVDVVPPEEMELGDKPLTRISVFMNVFDCHVNRSPISGRIVKMIYIPGKFLNAELDKASEHNERQCLTIETPANKRFGVVQIAGLVARRIVGFVHEGEPIGTGERFGLIRFGSRVDVYLPRGHNALVGVGQRAIAGETVLADIASKEPAREVRMG